MKHLPIPFEQKAKIIIKQGSKLKANFDAELATSPIEHFQALLYRKELKENSSVAFIFENPALPSFVNTNVPFKVDVIQFDDKGLITHLGQLLPSKKSGIFLTAFQTKYLLMVRRGFIKTNKLISTNESERKKRKSFIIQII